MKPDGADTFAVWLILMVVAAVLIGMVFHPSEAGTGLIVVLGIAAYIGAKWINSKTGSGES